MSYYLEVPLDGGETVLAEITEQVDDVVPAAGDARNVIGRLPKTLGAGLDRVQEFAGEVLERMRDLAEPPDVVVVEFGLKLTAKAGVVVAESSAEGHLTVKVEWHRSASEGKDGSAGPAPADERDAGRA